MELKKCARCGKFFASNADVCQECEKKDYADLSKLKGYFAEGYVKGASKVEISASTGISARNLNRYLGYEEFSGVYVPEVNGGLGVNQAGGINLNGNELEEKINL